MDAVMKQVSVTIFRNLMFNTACVLLIIKTEHLKINSFIYLKKVGLGSVSNRKKFKCFIPLSPESDEHQISPCNI